MSPRAVDRQISHGWNSRSLPTLYSVAGSETRIRADRLSCRLLLRDPGVILVLLDHFDDDRHVGMARTAKLGALAEEGAGLGRLGPGLVQTARHRVDLGAEGRDRPGMNHIGR